MLALIDESMSDLREEEVDPNAHTVFADRFAEDLTEVNLDLTGALESVMEKVTVNHRVRASSLPLWSDDIDDLVDQEFSISERTDEEDLPELPASEYFLVPPVDDLVIPARGRSVRRVLEVSKLPSVVAPSAPAPILVGKPVFAGSGPAAASQSRPAPVPRSARSGVMAGWPPRSCSGLLPSSPHGR
jgi:hypothetical protein